MKQARPPSPGQPTNGSVLDRNQMELIRFPSADAQRQAIGVLMERGMLNFSAHELDEWLVRTDVARKLRELGVPFEWLTEHV